MLYKIAKTVKIKENLTREMVKMPELQGPLAPHLDPASGPQTLCLWEFHFLEKEPPHFLTSLRACK